MADDSINLSIPSLQLSTLDTPEKLSPKKKKKGRTPSKALKDSMDSSRSFPDGDSVIVKQKAPPLPSGKAMSSVKKNKKSPKKKSKEERMEEEEDSDAREMDVSWEKAVAAARGLPEGAESSDEEMKEDLVEEEEGKPKKKKLNVSTFCN